MAREVSVQLYRHIQKMAHFIGKLNLASLINVRTADVEIDGEEQRCLVIPIKSNDIVQWKNEWQIWFRAFAYREPKTRFTHFLMKFVPLKNIRKMSSAQMEAFANHQIGGMIKCNFGDDEKSVAKEQTSEDFIKENL